MEKARDEPLNALQAGTFRVGSEIGRARVPTCLQVEFSSVAPSYAVESPFTEMHAHLPSSPALRLPALSFTATTLAAALLYHHAEPLIPPRHFHQLSAPPRTSLGDEHLSSSIVGAWRSGEGAAGSSRGPNRISGGVSCPSRSSAGAGFPQDSSHGRGSARKRCRTGGRTLVLESYHAESLSHPTPELRRR